MPATFLRAFLIPLHTEMSAPHISDLLPMCARQPSEITSMDVIGRNEELASCKKHLFYIEITINCEFLRASLGVLPVVSDGVQGWPKRADLCDVSELLGW